MKRTVAALRKNYSQKKLLENNAAAHPINQFTKWWKEALRSTIIEPNAMLLATATKKGVPSARVVLLKDYSNKGFVFFTNYESAKGKQLLENPRASLVFFWKELERQVRISGSVKKINPADSDTYFVSRPAKSRAGSLASPQSRIIPGRHWLDEKFREVLLAHQHKKFKRPDFWGGYIVKPISIEFWQGRPDRLHDRLLYTLLKNGKWKIVRLAP
jgi:pyridoxamine 5'-phosphate oxidase